MPHATCWLIQSPPNDGVLRTVGALGVNVDANTSFDVTPAGTAFVTIPSATGGTADLATINLQTGALARIGTIGGGSSVRALAAETPFIFRTFLPFVTK